MIVKNECPTCGKTAKVKTELIVQKLNKKLLHLECDHVMWTEIAPPTLSEIVAKLRSNKGKAPFQYQCDGVQFIEASNHRCLLADQQGLGKTIQGLINLKLHFEELGNILIVCKPSNIIQWMVEFIDWVFDPNDPVLEVVPTIIMGTDQLYSQSKVMIIGYETLGLIEDPDNYSTDAKKKRKNAQWLSKTFKIDTIIIDECQKIKNTGSLMTNAVQKLVSQAKHVIAMSGTPIRNRASEYFNVLNMIDPKYFWNKQSFLTNFCKVEVPKGKKTFQYTGLKNPEYFHNITKKYILRRERSEVMPDLPKVFRTFQYCDLGGQVKQAYIDEMKKFKVAYDKSGGTVNYFKSQENLLEYLQRMRHLTGRAKVIPTAEFVETFLDENPDEKLVIFVHHLDVGENLGMQIEERTGVKPLYFGSKLNPVERYAKIEEFRKPEHRVLISSTQSITGMNLQFCGYCILMERQWSPTDEEQAEDRFPRPGTEHEKVSATYMTALGTIDEFFAELVEQKRAWIATAIRAGKITQEEAKVMLSENSLMKELMEILATKGLKKWEMQK